MDSRSNPLPIELKSFLQDAEQYCAKAYQLTNKLRLSNLEVWRLNFPAGFKTNFGKKSPDFENQWFATLRFDQIKDGLAREVVRHAQRFVCA
jgi:hypothetical protein